MEMDGFDGSTRKLVLLAPSCCCDVTWKHQAKLLLGVKMLVRGRTALCLVGLVVLPSVGVVCVRAVPVVVC